MVTIVDVFGGSMTSVRVDLARPVARGDDARGTVVHVPQCICRHLWGASHHLKSVDGPKVVMNLWQCLFYGHSVPTKSPQRCR